MNYKHFNIEERCCLQEYYKKGLSYRKISERCDRMRRLRQRYNRRQFIRKRQTRDHVRVLGRRFHRANGNRFGDLVYIKIRRSEQSGSERRIQRYILASRKRDVQHFVGSERKNNRHQRLLTESKKEVGVSLSKGIMTEDPRRTAEGIFRNTI